ncbi:MAG: hypothetical protein AAF311_14670 [Pseudomonadota bacterium]
MRYFSFLSAAIMLTAAGVAAADCIVCDEVVEIDEARAACFRNNYAAIADAVARAPSGRKPIDLDACTIDGEALASRGYIGLPRIDRDSEEMPRSKAVYVLDLIYVDCLQSLLTKHEGSLDPAETFDLFELCER